MSNDNSPTVWRSQIEELRGKYSARGHAAGVELCERALRHDADALHEVIQILAPPESR